MTIKYLLDENVSSLYRKQLLRYKPDLNVCMIGEENVPPKKTPDPGILCWCEENKFLLITNNRSSMPVHLVDHLAAGRHVPAIFVLRHPTNIGRIIENLILIAEVADPHCYRR
ncbi:MAG: DUF5615 family PIN-like protein [Hormoscilla sp. GM102CHS1]|nr:DUF5615 family PIN-like protein [Hormoscilla sp. GM102CHS1]